MLPAAAPCHTIPAVVLTYGIILGLLIGGAGLIYSSFHDSPHWLWYASMCVLLFIALMIDVRLREIRDRLPPRD